MWGESEAVTITKRTPQEAYSIRLIRMVAKINVRLDKSVSGLTGKFKIRNVRLYNTYTKGRIAPGEVENGKVMQATVPDGAERYLGPLEYDDFSAPGEPDVAVRGSIYTFETPATSRTSEATCLVIGGIYMNDTKETYYRIDFLDEDDEYASILRNHQYTVNINNVTGSGYDTPEEAFEAKALSMSVEVLDWSEDGMYNVVFDGQFYLSISKNAFNFSKERYDQKGPNNVLTVFTNYEPRTGPSGWYIEGIKDAFDNTPVTWLSLVDEAGLPVERGDPGESKEIILHPEENQGATRTAIITFAAGRLRYPVQVTQTTRMATSILLFEGGPGDNGLQIDTLKFYHKTTTTTTVNKKFTVRWTPAASNLIVYEDPVQEPLLPIAIVPALRVVSGHSGQYDYTVTLEYDESYIGKATGLVFMVSNGVEITEKRLVIYYYPPQS
jgi:hypothetical protein